MNETLAFALDKEERDMALDFSLSREESVPDGVRRLAHQQLTLALKRLEEGGDVGERIHQIRKAMKRMRALVRLVRFELGDDIYRLENQIFRQVGRRLSTARDATVMVETLTSLVDKLPGKLESPPYAEVHKRLLARQRTFKLDEGMLEDIVETLVEARRRAADWPLNRPGWGAIKKGVKRVYRQGHQAFEPVFQHPTPEGLHQWRKSVKYLLHQVQLLQSLWPPVMLAMESALDQLGEELGLDHDLAVLYDVLLAEYSSTALSRLHALLESIEDRREKLHGSTFRLGQRLYCERPGAFVRRLHGYWRASSLPTTID